MASVVSRVTGRLRLQARRPTLLLRCILLLVAQLAANLILWIAAVIVFTRRKNADASQLLSLCLLAWTLGLRHGLDADHISIIDNATRRIVSLRNRSSGRMRRPVTCGLFFSLGHSTIVLSVLIAVAVSTSVVNRLGGVSTVGGIVGASVSGSFLFLFGVINSVLLWRSWSATRRERRKQLQTIVTSTATQDEQEKVAVTTANDTEDTIHLQPELEHGKSDHEPHPDDKHFRGVFTRMALPLLRMVDRPYKLYPIGILFGFGFDTASSIALLGVAAATNSAVVREDGEPVSTTGTQVKSTSDAAIVLLALLFTAGMTLVDSCDSILMVNAYAPGELASRSPDGNGKREWRLFERDNPEPENEANDTMSAPPIAPATATRFSHLITLASILLAFVISAIQILGLIGENCARCARAADKQQEHEEWSPTDPNSAEQRPPPGGLEGRWWLFWRRCGEESGIIGAGIVGAFAVALLAWYLYRLACRVHRKRKSGNDADS